MNFENASKKALIAVNFLGFVKFLWEDLDYLTNEGFQVVITGDFEIGYKDETLRKIKDYNAHFVHIPIDSKSPLTHKNLKGFKKLKSLIDKEKFDLIICHTAVTGIYVRLAAIKSRKRGTKVVYMCHGLSYNHTSSWKSKLIYGTAERFCTWFTDGIITINEEDYEILKKYHCPKVWKINGVGLDVDRYTNVSINRSGYRLSLGLQENKIIVVTAGEFSKRKNHQVVVKALSLLEDKDQYTFAVCGCVQTPDGETPDIVALGERLGVDIKLLGYRDDLEKVFACCDIGIMPSLSEGLGMAGVQMLCAGLPVVGSAVQGIREYCLNGKTGYLVDNPYDASGFADAIRLLSKKEIREKMKEACLTMSRKFSKEKSVAQRRLIYDTLLS